MAIVKAYHYPGATVYIDDDCYKDVPPEEMERRIARVERTAWEILRNGKKNEESISGRGV